MATAEVIGDIKEILKRINPMLRKQDHSDWMAHVMDLKEKYPASYCTDGLSGPFAVEEIYRQTKGDAIMVTEVGRSRRRMLPYEYE